MRSRVLAVVPGLRTTVLVLSALLVGAPLAASSLLEDATGGVVAYQFDADNHHDAPDECGDASPAWSLPFDGSTDGMLVPGDDMSDVFILDVPAEAVGSRLIIRLSEMVAAPNADFTVFAPGCAGSVLEPENHPVPHPRPPAAAAGEKQGTLENLAGPWECDSTAWVFKLTQLFGSPSPATIHAAWTNGAEETVALSQDAGVSRFLTSNNTGFLLTNAWINVPSDWEGHFTINRGPCDAVDGGAVYGDAPVLGLDRLSFTPVRPGPHEVSVVLAAPEPDVPTRIPASCHDCLGPTEGAAEKAEYVISSDKGSA